jgi:hypothetical protein
MAMTSTAHSPASATNHLQFRTLLADLVIFFSFAAAYPFSFAAAYPRAKIAMAEDCAQQPRSQPGSPAFRHRESAGEIVQVERPVHDRISRQVS